MKSRHNLFQLFNLAHSLPLSVHHDINWIHHAGYANMIVIRIIIIVVVAEFVKLPLYTLGWRNFFVVTLRVLPASFWTNPRLARPRQLKRHLLLGPALKELNRELSRHHCHCRPHHHDRCIIVAFFSANDSTLSLNEGYDSRERISWRGWSKNNKIFLGRSSYFNPAPPNL